MTSAAAILTLKPTPTSAIASTSSLKLPLSAARIKAQAASSSTRVRQLSVLLERSMATLIGVSARKAAARSAAPVPKRRATSL